MPVLFSSVAAATTPSSAEAETFVPSSATQLLPRQLQLFLGTESSFLEIDGQVVEVDSFGNLVTNISREMLKDVPDAKDLQSDVETLRELGRL